MQAVTHLVRARHAPLRSLPPIAFRSFATQRPSPPPSPDSPKSSSTPPPAPSSSQPSAVLDTPAPSSSQITSLDFSSEEREQRTGAKSSKDSLSTIERRRRILGRIALGMLVAGLGVQAAYLGREWEQDELKEKRLTIETAPSTRWDRTRTRFAELFDFFSKPQWNELLPPPLPAPYQKPMTLLIDLDDLLVTSTWDRTHGWRTAKRPGVDYFLAYLSQFYEIVLFTSQHYYTALPIVDKLDPHHFFIVYQLFRESMRSVNGTVVKDLSYLNRDLSKVITLDTNADFVKTHPENAIVLPKWTGDPRDKGLIAMIPFLESIGIYKPADVRPILAAYAGTDIPREYARKEVEAKKRHVEEWQASGAGKSGMSKMTLSGLFSSGPASSSSPIPPTYLEAKRAEAQQHYREEQAWIKDNKAALDKEKEDQDKAMAAEMTGSLWKTLSGVTGQPSNPESAPQAPGQGVDAVAAAAAQSKHA